MKYLIIMFIIELSAFSQNNHWKIVKYELEGDSLFFVKYRCDYMNDTGVIRRTMQIKFKGKNIRATDTAYKKIIIIPEHEVEE
jgi:predicted component of viral defense system (DUF524 family)